MFERTSEACRSTSAPFEPPGESAERQKPRFGGAFSFHTRSTSLGFPRIERQAGACPLEIASWNGRQVRFYGS
jgi:hypothetical protein